MTKAALAAIDDGMKALSLNYAFMRWNKKIVYPYFVGEYEEIESTTEDGLQECTFILNGFSRGDWSELHAAKEKIENYFRNKTVIADNGSAVAIFYSRSLVIPEQFDDAELKRIEIYLTIKEWKVV